MSSTTFTTNVLIGDRSAQGNVATPTKIGGVPIAAALELQSTSGAFVPPRMNIAQMTALVPTAPGSLIWNTDLNQYVFSDGAAWRTEFPAQQLFSRIPVSNAQINAMDGVPVPLLADPVGGNIIIIDTITLVHNFAVAYADGGEISIQYGPAVNGTGVKAVYGNAAGLDLMAPTGFIPKEILTLPGHVMYTANGGGLGGVNAQSILDYDLVLNQGIYMSNEGGQAFTGGNAQSTLLITISYHYF